MLDAFTTSYLYFIKRGETCRQRKSDLETCFGGDPL